MSLERGAGLNFSLERFLVECRKVIGFAFTPLDDWRKISRHFSFNPK